MEESPYLKAHEALRQKFETLPLHGSLEMADQRLVLNASRIQRFDAGELIMEAGQSERNVCVLLSGAVEVVNGGDGQNRLQRVGDIFGELCLVGKDAPAMTVKALQSVECLVIDSSKVGDIEVSCRDSFQAVIYRVFAELLAERLRATNDEVMALRNEIMGAKL